MLLAGTGDGGSVEELALPRPPGIPAAGERDRAARLGLTPNPTFLRVPGNERSGFVSAICPLSRKAALLGKHRHKSFAGQRGVRLWFLAVRT